MEKKRAQERGRAGLERNAEGIHKEWYIFLRDDISYRKRNLGTIITALAPNSFPIHGRSSTPPEFVYPAARVYTTHALIHNLHLARQVHAPLLFKLLPLIKICHFQLRTQHSLLRTNYIRRAIFILNNIRPSIVYYHLNNASVMNVFALMRV